MERICEHCGDTFYVQDDEHWKRLCYPCWKETRQNGQSNNAYTGTNSTPSATKQIAELTRALQMEREKNNRLQGEIARTSMARFPDGMIRRLLQLVHPDKHSGSQAANDATAWLLKQR